jgi:hypothetical protein
VGEVDRVAHVARVLQRRQNFCRTLEAQLIARFRTARLSTLADVAAAWYGDNARHAHYDDSRYHWINVHALFDKSTIEFRLFNGTLHAGLVKANILFALGMASTAILMRSISFKGQTNRSRTLPDGRRAVSSHDFRMFLVHVLCLVGQEFAAYRKHLAKTIVTE